MSLNAISFINDLDYDLVVYDSSIPDDPTDAENNYLGLLTSLGTVTAKSSSSIMPLQPGSAFVIESLSAYKPVKRCTVGPISRITSFTVNQTDEDTMTTTLKFIDFTLNNPNDAMTQAFKAMLQQNTDNLLGSMNAFFQQYPDYSVCTFPTYMMALVYTAQHPETKAKPSAEATYSLSTLVKGLGGTWPDGMPDITVSNFTCSTQNSLLDVKATIDISTLPFESDAIRDNVKSMFSSTTVKAEFMFNYAVSLGIFGTRLKLDLDNFSIPAGSTNIKVNSPSLTIDVNPLFKFVVFTLRGAIPFNIFSKAFNANLSMTVDNEEAAVGVTLDGDHSSLPAPPGLKGLFFDDFGVGMGVFFKPPAFALGVQGKFHIGDPSGGNIIGLNDDTFVLVCKFVEEVPAPVYASFYVPQLDANKVMELFTNKAPNFDVPVQFSDLAFKWSANPMEPIVLPDGSLSDMGYGFSATAKLFNFGFYGDVEIDLNNGLTADIEASPVNWNDVFKLSGDGKGVTVKVDANGNPIRNNQVATSKAMQAAIDNAATKPITTPGGPVLMINTFSSPILHLNAKASLFDLVDYAIEADINKDGIHFLLDYGAVLKEKMAVTLSDFHNLAASFAYYVDTTINIPVVNGVRLGSFHLAADTEAHLAITTNTSDVVMSVGGSFNFEGVQRNFGDFGADVHIKAVSDLIGAAVSYIESEATTLFSDFLGDAQKWAEKVKNGFITGADAVGSVLKNAFGKQSQEIAAIMKNVGYDANAIGSEIKNAFSCGVKDVSWALQQVGYDATAVANSVKNSFGDVVNDTTNALKDLGYAADKVAAGIQNAFGMNDNQVAAAMKQAGYGAYDIAMAIKNGIGSGIDEVAAALDQAGFGIVEVASAIKDAFGAGLSAVESALSAAGYGFLEIAKAIKNLFS
ncbi:hypothetical protein ACFQ4C_07595 [Larkinella insperata]|uniref:Uncharacterized protein n=1 Tax=Larkinella insperata TaxID=332158 RepID=A0ABW3Q6W2_9BACT